MSERSFVVRAAWWILVVMLMALLLRLLGPVLQTVVEAVGRIRRAIP